MIPSGFARTAGRMPAPPKNGRHIRNRRALAEQPPPDDLGVAGHDAVDLRITRVAVVRRLSVGTEVAEDADGVEGRIKKTHRPVRGDGWVSGWRCEPEWGRARFRGFYCVDFRRVGGGRRR